MPLITAERAREIFLYDPLTGLLTWKEAISNKSKVGETAGSLNITDGYLQVKAENKLYRVHRIAWLYMTGEWPAYVDHHNGIRCDNRWANLRSVSCMENMQNRTKHNANNRTGFLGVSLIKSTNKYKSCIQVNGKTVHLGVFESAELAHEKYVEAKRIYHPGCFFDQAGETDRRALRGRAA